MQVPSIPSRKKPVFLVTSKLHLSCFSSPFLVCEISTQSFIWVFSCCLLYLKDFGPTLHSVSVIPRNEFVHLDLWASYFLILCWRSFPHWFVVGLWHFVEITEISRLKTDAFYGSEFRVPSCKGRGWGNRPYLLQLPGEEVASSSTPGVIGIYKLSTSSLEIPCFYCWEWTVGPWQ